MKWLNVTSLILTIMLINSACSNSGLNSNKNVRNVEDNAPREFGTFSPEDIETLTADRSQLKEIHENNLRAEEERQKETEEEIRRVEQEILNRRNPEGTPEETDIVPPIEPLGRSEISRKQELEALDETALEEKLQTLTAEYNQFMASLDTSEDCQEVVECQMLLQDIKLVNDVLAEKRNENFNDHLANLSEEELAEIRAALEEEVGAIELEKSRAEKAIETIEQASSDDYLVRSKLFPNQKGCSNFPDVKGEDSKYARLYNKEGFQVQEVNVSTNQVVRQIDRAYSVKMSSNCPDVSDCSDNRVILDDNESITLRSGHMIKLTSLNTISSEGDNYLDLGFSKIEYSGVKKKSGCRGETGPREAYEGFYRGGFRIQFARQTKTSKDNHWSIFNTANVDEYLLSVGPGEIGRDEFEALLALMVAARTYVLNRAFSARTSVRNPRLWDVLPTVHSQLYMGAEKERGGDYYQAIVDTSGQILVVDDKIALAEFFSCTNSRTISSNVIEQKARNVPSSSCTEAVQRRLRPLRAEPSVLAFGHGRGFCQLCGVALARYGWSPTDVRRPTQGAVVPLDPSKPWTYIEILHYFYNETRVEQASSFFNSSEVSI